MPIISMVLLEWTNAPAKAVTPAVLPHLAEAMSYIVGAFRPVRLEARGEKGHDDVEHGSGKRLGEEGRQSLEVPDF